ncbi:putative disease resistance protein RGA3 [Chenopodium quinoa]|uniref:putative disease resistance protein RGA3 n=1 Tax=Chenopodium quinoa TaxID=63459 RepID=UPI000B773B6C|nr:putative disease resistance protein RGA3 [Chenopodium quinoa]
MAAEGVILENLERNLSREQNQWLLPSMRLVNLKESLEMIKGAVAALDVDEDHSIRGNLKNLVALLHQADDLLDEILTRTNDRSFPRDEDQNGNRVENLRRGLQRVVNASNRVAQQVSLLFPFSNRLLIVARRVEKIGQEIKSRGMQMLNNFDSNDRLERPFEPPQYTYSLTRSRVIGRDTEKQKIIEMLLRPLKKDETGVSVIPIVGPPGIGKSALAQFVYDDEKVKGYFDLRMWIQVSHISDEKEIIQEIVESCTNRTINKQNSKPAKHLHSRVHRNGLTFRDLLGCQSIDTSQTPSPGYSESKNRTNIHERRLQREIEGKLYLLILDDACITHGQRLKDLLAKGARGSRILVTTRSTAVANYAKTGVYGSYELGGLSQDFSWSLFENFALGQENQRDTEQGNERDPVMEKIGRAIAENCGGVPLTIKVAASLLYGKNKEKWSSFNSQLTFSANQEEDIMQHVLHFSYSDLPTRLKACFGYCSLFPDDFTFNKQDLLSLWIAQGFINPQHGRSLEKAADKYFLELSRRCFFEDVITDDLGNIITCKMHHILRTLACKYSAGIVSLCITDNSELNLDATCKHVSFTCDGDSLSKISSTKLESKTLRTLLSVNEPDSDTRIGPLVCNTLISSFTCLRVLDLNNLGIVDLPGSIGKLIHLRYLDLSKNDGLVALPKSVTDLHNLHTLKLNSCTKLRRLPCNFGELVNLGRFEIDECDNLTCMPLGLEKLTQIETLSRFIVGEDFSKDMAGLKALQDLNNLRGRLAIEFTGVSENIISEASQAELSSKTHLRELKLSWAKTVSNVEIVSHNLSEEERIPYEQLLQNLRPNSELQILCIEGYKGGDFPNWAGVNGLATSLPNLVVISIEGCEKCEHLPPFDELPSLKRLTLRHMANVRYVEREASVDSPFFPSLEELTLHNFYKLEGWRKEVTILPDSIIPLTTSRQQEPIRSFPHLSKLMIWNCPNLISMPLFMKVLDLNLCNVNQMLLEECAKKAVRQVGKNSSIRYLQIKGCPNLKSFDAVRQGLGNLPCLKHLVVERCHALSLLASELKHLSSLERLEISSCRELNLSDNGASSTGNFNTQIWIPGRIVHHLRGSLRSPWTSLKCLRHLTLREIPKMERLPEGLKHVQSLRSLWISACPALKELPEWIGTLTALQHLRIESCRQLTRLPEGLQHVISLMKVEITECPELMERCKEHTGEDWYKIKHAQVLLHKSWRYGLMSELEASKNRSNVRTLTDVKYFIVPLIAAGI